MTTSTELENLVKVGQLKREASIASELAGLRRSGEARLADAANPKLAIESRFDLAYNAAHALASAALRRLGYRAENRYTVFQTLPHTLGLPTPVWRVLMKAHTARNQAEYEGLMQADERLVTDLIAAAQALLKALRAAERSAGS
jgi:hypothetical protein